MLDSFKSDSDNEEEGGAHEAVVRTTSTDTDTDTETTITTTKPKPKPNPKPKPKGKAMTAIPPKNWVGMLCNINAAPAPTTGRVVSWGNGYHAQHPARAKGEGRSWTTTRMTGIRIRTRSEEEQNKEGKGKGEEGEGQTEGEGEGEQQQQQQQQGKENWREGGEERSSEKEFQKSHQRRHRRRGSSKKDGGEPAGKGQTSANPARYGRSRCWPTSQLSSQPQTGERAIEKDENTRQTSTTELTLFHSLRIRIRIRLARSSLLLLLRSVQPRSDHRGS